MIADMRRRLLATVTIAVAVNAILVSAASAAPSVSSRPGYTVYPPREWSGFQLQGTHGFTVLVTIEDDLVRVEAVGRHALVVYESPAEIVGNRIRARLANLGIFTMAFEKTGRLRSSSEPQGDCRGRHALVQKGIFSGRFKWRGETAFSQAMTRETPGIFVRSFREVCKGLTAAIGEDKPAKPLLVASFQGRRQLREVEIQESSVHEFAIIGRLSETRPGVSTERSVFSFLEEGELQVDQTGNRMIAPDPPFRGSAEFRADIGETERWRGDLEASFPGRGFLPLAGSPFEIRPE